MAILSFFHDTFIFVNTMATKQRLVVGQLGAGIRGNYHPGLNSDFFFDCSSDVISLAGNLISWQSTGEGVNSTPTAHTCFSYSHLVTDFTYRSHASRVAQESRSTLLESFHKTFTLHRAMFYVTPHLLTPCMCTPSSLVLNRTQPFSSPSQANPISAAETRRECTGPCSGAP